MLYSLHDNLFKNVLIAPASELGVNRIQIVSGFATAGMADRHMEKLTDINSSIRIELIVGMARSVGIAEAQHLAFQNLIRERAYNMDISCRYVVRGNPVHAKTYCWLIDDKPVKAFSGSANYTLTAFSRSQIETMVLSDQNIVKDFYDHIYSDTFDCLDADIENHVALTKAPPKDKRKDKSEEMDTVDLSLLDTQTRETPERSGINWGQRGGRDKDQAYISIPANIGRSGFFPDRYEQFTVLTDDNYSFIMVRAQDTGKALHTTQNNALLGKYLRKRMGLPEGIYVTRQHLEKYGRTTVSFTKLDNETYLMDFRPNMEQGEESEEWQE